MDGRCALNEIIANIDSNNGNHCNYELILMDCQMPMMDGYEATQMIREYVHSKGLPQPIIIAVTGHCEDSYVKRAIASGMNEVSSKPVDLKLIKEVLIKLKYI